MLEKIKSIESRYDEINKLLEVNASDYQLIADLSREKAEIEQVVLLGRELRQAMQQIDETNELLNSTDPDFQTLANQELEVLIPKAAGLESALKTLLLPKDPRDNRNVIMEIRAGTGGDEASLFAAELFRMYSHYAEKNKWSVEVLSLNEIGIGGIKEVVFLIKGKGAFSRFKYESGVHRVQRVPVTESSGRIHTSTITVAVLAEVEDVDIHIPDNDIRYDIYRSAGAGGQNVQKNSTAVRITHLPTGIVVACQDERSQLQNKLRAMSILRAKLFELEELRRQNEQASDRRSQVGTGERSEKIRTYNYPQSRVTDHRINMSSYNLTGFLSGNFDEFIDELSLREQTEKLATISE